MISQGDRFDVGALLYGKGKFDEEGNPDSKTRAELEVLLTTTEGKIADVYSEGDLFALRCMNTFMSDGLHDRGFIGRMIKAKRELREIPVNLKKAEFQLLNLQTCREAANLLQAQAEKQKALAACVTTNN